MAAEATSAAEFVPESRSLRTLRRAAADCRGCPLWRDATQTVFGAGPRKAKLMWSASSRATARTSRESRSSVLPAASSRERWLDAELGAVRPSALLALGATAARALFGPSLRVTRDRSRLIESPLAPFAAITVHPSAIPRVRDRDEREAAFAGLVEDLRFLVAAAEQK